MNYIRAQIRRFALWLLSLVDACPTCGAPWSEHRCPYMPSLNATGRVCAVCAIPLPLDAVRSAMHGEYRCRQHKVDA